MNKFGIFFTKENFRDLVDFFYAENDRMEMYELRQNIFNNIVKSFYSKVENSYNLDITKRGKLMYLKRINENYINNYDLYYFKKIIPPKITTNIMIYLLMKIYTIMKGK